MNDDDDVPFIEVGGPRPVMKHLETIAPRTHRVAATRNIPPCRRDPSAARGAFRLRLAPLAPTRSRS